ncbi:WhiB family transcriptional regulator [Streptomyces silaceus]|uniref:WhiB family transcriptional regulator n=1 Tax=Streptomyces silaceus TaxID=545123 RepID=UPI0006EB962C|nr:WhiB family transcriptional regulator [Streptomyces silaceus]
MKRHPRPSRSERAVARDEAHNWRRRALCSQADPDLFFPVGTSTPAQDQVRSAKDICAACPVAGVCLRWAMEAGVPEGIWGGRTAQERRQLAHEMARQRSDAPPRAPKRPQVPRGPQAPQA